MSVTFMRIIARDSLLLSVRPSILFRMTRLLICLKCYFWSLAHRMLCKLGVVVAACIKPKDSKQREER